MRQAALASAIANAISDSVVAPIVGASTITPIFALDFTTAPTLGTGTGTTRTSSAWAADAYRYTERVSGEQIVEGGRHVVNLADKVVDFGSYSSTVNVTWQAGYPDPFGGVGAVRVTVAGGIGSAHALKYVGANAISSVLGVAWIKKVSGVGSLGLYRGANSSTAVTPTESWQRMVSDPGNPAGNGNLYYGFNNATDGLVFDIFGLQLEDTTGLPDPTIPSEFISRGVLSYPYHGLGVDGRKVFAYTNPNRVVSNVVYDDVATTPLPCELVVAPGATNIADGTHDFGTGADVITLPSTGNYTLSVYGTAAMTIAAGTATITGGGQATDGNPVTINCTATGTVTLTLDSGTLDTFPGGQQMVNLESGTTATLPIPTAGASASRTADTLPFWIQDGLEAGTITVTVDENGIDVPYTSGRHTYNPTTDKLELGNLSAGVVRIKTVVVE